jgi:SAM-dependent methyltransferase
MPQEAHFSSGAKNTLTACVFPHLIIMVLKLATKLAKKLHYKLFLAPKGYGQSFAQEELEQQYREGVWDFLGSIDELANYMVTVGYIQHFAKSLDYAPRLLDMGCGDGNFLELMSNFHFQSYLGLDLSEEAIQRASARSIPNANFQVADFEEWSPTDKFDFIISTGSICYAKDPVAVLQRFAQALDENGAFIISLWRYGHNGIIWQNIEKHFTVIDSTIVQNHKKMMWDVKVLTPMA